MKSSSNSSSPESFSQALAHSAKDSIPAQSYREHVTHVNHLGEDFFSQMIYYYAEAGESPLAFAMKDSLMTATLFHDLGKLDSSFQVVLQGKNRHAEKVQHAHAGTTFLLTQKAFEAAGLVTAHHQGLLVYREEMDEEEPIPTGEWDKSYFLEKYSEYTIGKTRINLPEYLNVHNAEVGQYEVKPDAPCLKTMSGLQRRLLLSCLVDADHSDTARNYEKENEVEIPEPRWEDRILALDSYVKSLDRPGEHAGKQEKRRQTIRDQLYKLCCSLESEDRLISCDSAVGSGKTTALMAHLLRVARDRQLRHIIIVLPYTNIITQSVRVYRKALCLPGENPQEIVAEHHHQADFQCHDIRYLSTLWRAPIIVTTAVQFFETLAANKPARLRKLHELPGVAVCLDEAHNALPYKLWPLAWRWLNEWTKDWKGHLVLSSGSLPAFWEDRDFNRIMGKQPSSFSVRSLTDSTITEESMLAEKGRVRYQTERNPLSESELIKRIVDAPSPRLVVVNSLLAAAQLATCLKEKTPLHVLHLSTALAPIDRDVILERIKKWLTTDENWVLVATSLVEAGMDFSFASGFRQRASAASLIQLGGRINRHSKQGTAATILDFTFADTKSYPDNPSLKYAQKALEELFKTNQLDPEVNIDLKKVCLLAMQAEFREQTKNDAQKLIEWEDVLKDYPEVSKNFKVIDTDTVTVVVNFALSDRLRNHEKVYPKDVQRNSVQMSSHKIELYDLCCLYDDLYCLKKDWEYDPEFLGYMKEVLRNNTYKMNVGGYYI